MIEMTHHGGRGRGIHEIEAQDVVDAHRLEREHGHGQVGALDLRHIQWQHLVLERGFGVQPVTLAGPGAPCMCAVRISVHTFGNDPGWQLA